MKTSQGNKKYNLYLAGPIKLWKEEFKPKYSKFFNKKICLFEPGAIDISVNHKLIPKIISDYDLNEINKSHAILAYIHDYVPNKEGPAGTDSSWECGYAVGQAKPVIVLVSDLQHLEYYEKQWMVTYNLNAILTINKEVIKKAKQNEHFSHLSTLFCKHPREFESKIIEYLDQYCAIPQILKTKRIKEIKTVKIKETQKQCQ